MSSFNNDGDEHKTTDHSFDDGYGASILLSVWISQMFGGMFLKKPSKEEALMQLRSHGLMFEAWVVAIRVSPYVLQYFQKEEITLDL
uniref:Uncharacterized protein n=2 Tax=Chenopodium quinoa TaxID=63459 RepID=A0A803N1E5_CHEQI